MMSFKIALVCGIMAVASAQRGSYSGISRPSGYKDRLSPNNINTNDAQVVDRFGENNNTNGVAATTQRLPYDAHGDRFAFNQLSQLPLDKQPFWLINYQAIEAHRGTPIIGTIPSRFGNTGQVMNPSMGNFNQQSSGQFIPNVQNPNTLNSQQNGQFNPNPQNGQFNQNSQNGQFNPSAQNRQFNPSAQNGQFNPSAQNGQFNPSAQNGQFNPNFQNSNLNSPVNNQQNLPVRLNIDQTPQPQVNPELNRNNFGFGIPQGTQGHYAGK